MALNRQRETEVKRSDAVEENQKIVRKTGQVKGNHQTLVDTRSLMDPWLKREVELCRLARGYPELQAFSEAAG